LVSTAIAEGPAPVVAKRLALPPDVTLVTESPSAFAV